MPLRTLENKPFLAVNGTQTLSHDYLNLVGELADLQAMGVTRFRLSPHSCDMVEVTATFRAVLDRRIEAPEAAARLDALKLDAPFSNDFYYGKPGHSWNRAGIH
jgi:collagenase-like PrtC family protease